MNCRKSSIEQVVKLAKGLNVVGLMNTQFAIQNNVVYLLEVNPRASRTVPFVSKASGIAAGEDRGPVMVGETLVESQGYVNQRTVPPYFSVKESVFPFIKFAGADPILGPEMKSTGEVMGVGRSFGEAYAKAQLASGVTSAGTQGTGAAVVCATGTRTVPSNWPNILVERGFDIVATHGTAQGTWPKPVSIVGASTRFARDRPHIVDMIKNGEIDR